MNFLVGYKTYLAAACAALTLFLQQSGIITEEQGKSLLEAFGVLMVVALRMAVATTTAVASTNLAVTTGTVSESHAKAVSEANPPPPQPKQ